MTSSWATSKPGGYTEEDLRLLRDLVPPLSPLPEIHSQRNVTRTLLNTYLGREPGEAVLAGRVRRGDVARIEGLCGALGRRVLASAARAAHIEDGLVSLGSFKLKGEPQALCGVAALPAACRP